MTQTEHAKLGASASSMFINCSLAGKALLEADTTSRTSVYAAEGTVAHDLCEAALMFGVEPEHSLNQHVEVDGHWIVVEQEMIDHVHGFVKFVNGLTSDHPEYLRFEQRVTLDPLYRGNPPTPLFGTADVLYRRGDTLGVVDLKYGKGVEVHVTNNHQLRYYALGAYYSLPRKIRGLIGHIEISIYQPRLGNEATITMPVAELIEWGVDVLRPAIDRAVNGPHEATPGDHCQFCPKRANCPGLYAKAQEIARTEFAGSPILPVPTDLTDEEIGNIVKHRAMLRAFISAMEDEAMRRIRSGHSIPGAKMVKKKGARLWIDEQPLIRHGHVTAMSVAQVEKMMGKKDFAKFYGSNVHMPDGGVTIAPSTDRRKEVTVISAAQDFADAEDYQS